ncbi:MAG: hypothetical protein LBS01_10175 [Prevotellaceae bacterium]|jgi:hypothetical protein|nr:hypothetical protein [Prevotellaceae bacterium]
MLKSKNNLRNVAVIVACLAVNLVTFSGCETASKTPSGITKELYNYFEKGDYETFYKKTVEYLYEDIKSGWTEEYLQTYVQDQTKITTEEMAKMGGCKKVETEEDGGNDNTVGIKVTLLTGNGKAMEMWYAFENTNDGWKIMYAGYEKPEIPKPAYESKYSGQPVSKSELLFEIYSSMIMNSLIKILFFLALVVPSVLYFIKRKNNDFSRQIKMSAFADIAFVAFWLVILIIITIREGKFVGNLPSITPNGVPFDLLYIALGALRVFAVWKMKAGTKFGSLFKKPDCNLFLFIVYLLMTAFVIVKTVIGLFNYIIFGIAIVFLWWLIVKRDVLNLFGGASASLGGSSSGNSPANQCCASCSRYNNGKCVANPEKMIDEPQTYSCGNYFRR